MSLGMLLFALVILILLSGFFSASETAMMRLNRYRLRHLVKSGHASAIRAQNLLQRPDRLIGIILLGNNFVNILASSLATVISYSARSVPRMAPSSQVLPLCHNELRALASPAKTISSALDFAHCSSSRSFRQFHLPLSLRFSWGQR